MAITLDLLGVWTTALFIVMIWSLFLVRDNPFFRFAESTTVGISLAYLLVFSGKYVYDLTLTPLIKGDVLQLIPLVIGLLVFARTGIGKSTRYAWVSKIPIAVVVGVGVGLSMRGEVELNLLTQIRGLIMPLIGGPFTPLDNLISIILAVSILAYFTFTRQQKGPWGRLTKIGRYSLMAVLGLEFANVAFGRFSWFAQQILLIIHALGLH